MMCKNIGQDARDIHCVIDRHLLVHHGPPFRDWRRKPRPFVGEMPNVPLHDVRHQLDDLVKA
jgi:hypothetical protein